VIRNSIVANNSALALGPDLRVSPGAPAPQLQFSLLGSKDGTGLNESPANLPDGNGNRIGRPINGLINPQLGPLSNDGGPTQTHALLVGSPATNAGDPALVGPPTTDQRGTGFPRVSGGRLDMGALEVQSMLPDGDFDNDGLYNCVDIDALVAAIASGTNNLLFDLTGDALVNVLDRNAWLAEAGGINLGPGRIYRLGDATLDGVVDGSDFNRWNSNKFTAQAAWCCGDFTADGVIDGSDFNAWNSNKFTSSDAGRVHLPGIEDSQLDRVVDRTDLGTWNKDALTAMVGSSSATSVPPVAARGARWEGVHHVVFADAGKYRHAKSPLGAWESKTLREKRMVVQPEV
jgi:hypothetical protein